MSNTDTKRLPKSESFLRAVWRRMRRNPRAMAGLAFVALMGLVSLLAPVIANNQPIVCRYEGKLYFPALVEVFIIEDLEENWLVRRLPQPLREAIVIRKPKPFNLPQFNAKKQLDPKAFAIWPLIPYHKYEQTDDFLQPPSARHWFGTDDLGRDIAARMIHGTSVSFKVGFVSMGIAALIGIVVGGIAGYCGGWVDMLFSRVIEIVVCFPLFFLILAIMAWLRPNIMNVMIVIGLTRWTGIARYTRAEFIRIKGLDYVTAARALGIGHTRIMFRDILPNSLAPVMVSVTFGIASAILVEAALSWLGFGVQPPAPSWGNILRTAYDTLRVAPHIVYPPCVAIFLAVMSFNLVGDGLRDAIDPRLKVG